MHAVPALCVGALQHLWQCEAQEGADALNGLLPHGAKGLGSKSGCLDKMSSGRNKIWWVSGFISG